MIEFQQENCFFILNTQVPMNDQVQFFNANYWQQKGRILGSAQGRGTTWFLQTQDLFGVNATLRHYYRGGLLGKFVKDRYVFQQLTKTRSFSEFSLLNQLYQTGLPVPKPLGARVSKGKLGICYQADILAEKVEYAQDLTAFLQNNDLQPAQWVEIGKVIKQLHNQQVCHADLNAHNILVQQTDSTSKIWLIDFDKCAQKSGNAWKAANLRRLHRSFVKEVERMGIRFSQQNWQDLLAGYQA